MRNRTQGKYITWGLVQDPFKGYPEQFIEFKVVHNMDIDTNSNGNSNQVGKLTDSPTVEPELDTVDENLNTPPLPSPSVTLEYLTENLTKPL